MIEKLVQTLIVIALTPLCMITSLLAELYNTAEMLRELWSAE